MDNRQATCKDRIESNLKGRIKEFEELLKLDDETFWDQLDNHVLHFGDDPYYRGKRLQLSYGGPADYFIFFTELNSIVYHFLDWHDEARSILRGHDYEVMHQVYKRITE